jgi:RimJ/RimL family protein N-acetyltransferase
MKVRALTDTDGQAIASWRYEGRDATYNALTVPTQDQGIWAVEDAGELVGSCCFGSEARVPGVEAEEGTLDIGYGLRPDLVGLGNGRAFVEAILASGTERFAPERLRLLILDWNMRSRKVAEACGFIEERRIESTEGSFLVMLRTV